MKLMDRYYMFFDKGIYFMVYCRKFSLGDMCYFFLLKVLLVCYGMGIFFYYKMEIKIVSNVDGVILFFFKVDVYCCNEDFKVLLIFKDGFLIVFEDRLVEVLVLFLFFCFLLKFGNLLFWWGDF